MRTLRRALACVLQNKGRELSASRLLHSALSPLPPHPLGEPAPYVEMAQQRGTLSEHTEHAETKAARQSLAKSQVRM